MAESRKPRTPLKVFVENLSKGIPPWEAARRAGLDPSKAWIYVSAAASAGLVSVARRSPGKCSLGACEKCPLDKVRSP